MPYKIEDSHLVDIFTKNLIPEMSFHMKMASPEDFATVVKKGKNIENGLLEKGAIKHYNSSSSHNEVKNNSKPKFCPKTKVSQTMVSPMSRIFKEETTTTIQTMTIKIKTINNLVIKHNFFHATITIPTTITTMTMIVIGCSLTSVSPWKPYSKSWWITI